MGVSYLHQFSSYQVFISKLQPSNPSLMSGLRATSQILQRELNKLTVTPARMMSGVGETSTPGQGAGQGGGAGGSFREAGGSMGKRQAAQEEQFFRDEQQRQIQEYKDKKAAQDKAAKK